MSLLEESLFSDSGASVSVDCEAGSGPTIRPLRSWRALRENAFLPLCSREGGWLSVLPNLYMKNALLPLGGGSASRASSAQEIITITVVFSCISSGQKSQLIGREPGFAIFTPEAQSGHSPGLQVGKSTEIREA